MRLIYTIGICFYTLGVRVAALFGHEKARQMVRGWRSVVSGQCSVFSDATQSGGSQLNTEHLTLNTKTAWFHAASLGEFEQARPVLERYREMHPGCCVVVTFFSPSGYEVRKNYALADAVLYLPPDLPRSVRRFLDIYRPTVAFFVKYDFWFNYLGELHRRNIPTYIFSAIFRPGQYFFKPWGKWFMRQLVGCYSHIFVQNDESLQLLKSHGMERCSIAGDTRFDRVHQIAEAAERNEVVERWLEGHDGRVLVCGSTWPPDEEQIAKLKAESGKWKVILAPHVISEVHLQAIEKLFPNSVRYSQFSTLNSRLPDVLIIDNIGMLSKLYRYADVAYIGGGFGVGIHNILEAVTFGKPVLFGPNYGKFKEARDIIARGGGFSHSDADGLRCNLLPLLTDGEAYGRASEACTAYMMENLGSTEKILSTIED